MHDHSQRFYCRDARALAHDGFGWDHTGGSLMLPVRKRVHPLAGLWQFISRRK